MARSTSLTEAEAGITCFASSLPGFRGVLKHRYSDFIVHEGARDGSVARLTSFDLPDEVSLALSTPIPRLPPGIPDFFSSR